MGIALEMTSNTCGEVNKTNLKAAREALGYLGASTLCYKYIKKIISKGLGRWLSYCAQELSPPT